VLEDDRTQRLIIEATTSWSYVGPGLRLQMELLGPEYAMEFNSLNTGLRVFMSRAVSGSAGEDLVEKQNAEQGLMPILEDEAGVYGYTLEDRHMVERFRQGKRPLETFEDGVAVVELLMALYKSAETGQTVTLPDAAGGDPGLHRPQGGAERIEHGLVDLVAARADRGADRRDDPCRRAAARGQRLHRRPRRAPDGAAPAHVGERERANLGVVEDDR